MCSHRETQTSRERERDRERQGETGRHVKHSSKHTFKVWSMTNVTRPLNQASALAKLRDKLKDVTRTHKPWAGWELSDGNAFQPGMMYVVLQVNRSGPKRAADSRRQNFSVGKC